MTFYDRNDAGFFQYVVQSIFAFVGYRVAFNLHHCQALVPVPNPNAQLGLGLTLKSYGLPPTTL